MPHRIQLVGGPFDGGHWMVDTLDRDELKYPGPELAGEDEVVHHYLRCDIYDASAPWVPGQSHYEYDPTQKEYRYMYTGWSLRRKEGSEAG